MRITFAWIALAAGLLAPAPRAGLSAPPAEPPPDRPQVVVTTTLLGSAVADLMPGCDLLVLTPGTACPGQFDLGPDELTGLRRASLFLRHDYEKFLDSRLMGSGLRRDRLQVIETRGSQIVPEGYLGLCADISRALSSAFPTRADSIRARLDGLRSRIGRTGEQEQERARPRLEGKQFLVASYQTDFVAWAGGGVAAAFERGEDTPLSRLTETLQRARAAKVAGVVGNLQWGDREARAMAEALGVRSVQLSSYPAEAGPGAYPKLLAANVDALLSLAGDE